MRMHLLSRAAHPCAVRLRPACAALVGAFALGACASPARTVPGRVAPEPPIAVPTPDTRVASPRTLVRSQRALFRSAVDSLADQSQFRKTYESQGTMGSRRLSRQCASYATGCV